MNIKEIIIAIGIFIISAWILVMFTYFITGDKKVRGYYLTDVGEKGTMCIGVDRDWTCDDKIILNGCSYERAVQLIDSLNKTTKGN